MSLSNPFSKKDDAKDEESAESAPSGMTRKSLSKGKPARPAAQGVRVVSASGKRKATPAKPLTKEERKARRRAEREEEDQVANISNILMKQDPEYLKLRRIWWVLLGVGFVFILGTFALSTVAGNNGTGAYDTTTTLGLASVVLLVVSYILIIGAFVFEFAKIRPLRNAAMAKVHGMSQKRRQAVINAEYEAEERKRAEKAARKAKK